MKQNIKIGNVVDDGQGDYLRKGAMKINQNFDEIYNKLGDDETVFPAGAWKTFNAGQYDANFGDSLALNTSNGKIIINLPKGNVNDYNKVIKLRDVWRSWASNPVELVPANGDTVKGMTGALTLAVNYMDVELVYCHLGRWEYAPNKAVNSINSIESASVLRKQVLVKEDGQRDFFNVFGNNNYNPAIISVQKKGNTLYHVDSDKENWDFGSPSSDNLNDMIALDGKSIRLSEENKCEIGDVLTFETFLEGIATYKSSYESYHVRVFDTKRTNLKTDINNSIFVGDIGNKYFYSVEEFGIGARTAVNASSLNIFKNSTKLYQTQLMMDDINYTANMVCSGASGESQAECELNGGEWIQTYKDYEVESDDFNRITGITLYEPLEHGDIIEMQWFNNDIGSLLEWDGADGIRELADQRYLVNDERFNLKNRIEYTDFNNPKQSTKRDAPDIDNFRPQNLTDMFEMVYPIGTIYSNAHNPANPASYMGFGVWVRWAEGMVSAGWDTNQGGRFNKNPQDLDSQGNPTATSGGTFGSMGYEITPANIPEMKTSESVLVKDNNGNIIIGGCQVDPDDEGPVYDKYREDKATISKGIERPLVVDLVQPTIVEHKWVRVG